MLAKEFIERIAAAENHADIVAASAEASSIDRSVIDAAQFNLEVATAAHAHLARLWRHPGFHQWLDCYFGRRPTHFRSVLQKPNFLYYPRLDPKPWFRTEEIPELQPLAERIPTIREELRHYLGLQPEGFAPYVPTMALSSATWRPLAGQEAWSALHLIRRNEWSHEHLSQLPHTTDFLRAAPLALCPPHAPECFVSRLQPGTTLPPHHGLSNIKLTVHLPVLLPLNSCSITVAGVRKTWHEEDFLAFDDSFLHTASNLSDTVRTVMIFDVWHPHLDAAERTALAYAIAVLEEIRKVTG